MGTNNNKYFMYALVTFINYNIDDGYEESKNKKPLEESDSSLCDLYTDSAWSLIF